MNVNTFLLRIATLFGFFFGMGLSQEILSQPIVTAHFANPEYDCNNNQYCLDVEFQSNTPNKQIFGMNVRLFYDDAVLEFIGFSEYANGYGPVVPNPPLIATSIPAGPALFNFLGAAEFINGSIQLVNANAPAILISTTGWTRIFQMCFIVESAPDEEEFSPSVVWDLEQNPMNGGFLAGDDGVVITIVDPDPNIDSAPTSEHVGQYNWEYIGGGSPPYGQPSPDTIINVDCSLPVRLLSFTGYSTETGNHLEWKTTFEINNAGFEVQRSIDGVHWENLGFVKSAEAIQNLSDYSFMDSTPPGGSNKYRLKQMDVDGKFSFSPVVILVSDKRSDPDAFTVYPNPVTEGVMTVEVSQPLNEGTTLQVFNALGYLLREIKMEDMLLDIDVSDLPSGMYLLRFSGEDQKMYKKIVIEGNN